MLEHAEREKLSVRELRECVVAARRCLGERRGPPARGATDKAVSALEGDVRRLVDAIGRLQPRERLDLRTQTRVAAVASLLAEASVELAALSRGNHLGAAAAPSR